jgi:phosphoserine phosphatase RsbU/P
MTATIPLPLDQAAGKGESILIVDDAPANVRLLSQMLTSHGYRVRAATSGAHALASVAAQPPTLILLDIRMKGMNGYEVCDELKRDLRTCDIPVIFISALADVEDKLTAFHHGCVDYVTKPFHIAEVLARIETHLALRRLQAQLQEANRKFARELALAGTVQCGFLPAELPQAPGWQFAAQLLPARETSGDFYDCFPLPGNRLALVVADVVDKGVAAALFMALSLSLVRTHAALYRGEPAHLCGAVNSRLRQDAHAEQFVTLFFGVLDLATGSLSYANAGQNPPLLVAPGGAIQQLGNTGPPLGILDRYSWQQATVDIPPQGILVLYTDGVTEAENEAGDFFGQQRLIAALQEHRHRPAAAIQTGLVSAVRRFTAGARQLDDIALLVAARTA